MFESTNPTPIAIYGSEVHLKGRGVGLWTTGYQGTLAAAGAKPVFLKPARGDRPWGEILAGTVAVIACGFDQATPGKMGDVESLCMWCRENRFPLLAIDAGMLAMNAAFGGMNYSDLSREMPEALQHRHPPEYGVRHAINILPDTLMAKLMGEGEVVVNSEHRAGIQRLARCFVATAIALDNVIEAIEYTKNDWFALGVQWQPASTSASGLDIQVFRALLDAVIPASSAGARPAMAMAG